MQTLLNLLAGVALLVWGTHIVRTGILRLYGADLRRVLRKSVNQRFTAFLAGLGVTGADPEQHRHRADRRARSPARA